MKDIGKRLKTAREAIGLDQAGFAIKLGVTRNTVSRWELGHAFPQVDVLRVIHDQFGIDPTWIVTGNGSMWGLDLDGMQLLLRQIIEDVERIEEEYGKKLGATKKAELVLLHYGLGKVAQDCLPWETKRKLFRMVESTDEPKSDD